MRDQIKIIVSVLLLAVVLVAWTTVQDKKLPSEVKKDISTEFRAYRQSLSDDQQLNAEQWYAKRAEIASKHLGNVKIDGLDRQETYNVGDLYAWAQMNDKAKEVFSELAKGNDVIARNASKQIISFAIEDESVDASAVRKMLADYRKRFAPSAEDSFGLYGQVNGLARQLNEKGNKEEAIAVINDEIAYLDYDSPYWAWRIVVAASNYQDKADAVAMLGKYREKFESIANKRKETIPVADGDKAAYEKETKQWESLATSMLARENRLKVTDAQAPDLTFTHFFNTEPIKFSSLRGKVVVLDFWANWCGPCISTFPEMRKMYEKYKDTDVQIIGVTGFQGSMTNHGQPRVQDLSEEKELELTKVFIDYQKVTWPIAFSTRNCYDVEYGIQGIPTMVIIDKKGIVRMFEHPANKEKIIELIEKLRAE